METSWGAEGAKRPIYVQWIYIYVQYIEYISTNVGMGVHAYCIHNSYAWYTYIYKNVCIQKAVEEKLITHIMSQCLTFSMLGTIVDTRWYKGKWLDGKRPKCWDTPVCHVCMSGSFQPIRHLKRDWWYLWSDPEMGGVFRGTQMMISPNEPQKKGLTFHYTGCLIGILRMVYSIVQITEMNCVVTILKSQFFSLLNWCQRVIKWICCRTKEVRSSCFARCQ